MLSDPGCFLVGCVYFVSNRRIKHYHALLHQNTMTYSKKKLFRHLLPLFRPRVKKPRSVCLNPCSVSVGAIQAVREELKSDPGRTLS